MKKNNTWKIWMHLLNGASFLLILKLIYNYGFELRLIYIVRVLYVLTISFLLIPFRIIEYLIFDKKIKAQQIHSDPIFIIGHWRSGTTYLHNLFTQDNQFGFISTFQAFVPGAFLTGNPILKFGSDISMPSKRPMDDVNVHPDFPQEEEFAIANHSHLSFYHSLYYPSLYNELADKYVFFKTIEKHELLKWKHDYFFLLKKITLAAKGKQLVLKNPINTSRISVLLEMFPNAKFIYLHRNAKETIASTKKMNIKFCEINNLRSYNRDNEDAIIEMMFYNLKSRYEQDKHKIPLKNLIEINYSNLIFDTQKTMEDIYHKLQLVGYSFAKTKFEKYILLQKEFKRDVYS